jgi:hypothetical protein
LNPDKLAKKSYRVQIFVQEGRLVPDEELKHIKHRYSPSEGEEESDDEDSTD